MSTPQNSQPAPKKRRNPFKIAGLGCLGLLALLLVIGIIGAGVSGTLGQAPEPEETTEQTQAAEPTPTPTPTPTPEETTPEATEEPTPEETTPAPVETTEAPEPTPTPEPTTEAPEPTPEPTPEATTPADPFAAITEMVSGATAHQEGDVLFIEFPIDEGLFGPATSTAQKDTVDLLGAVKNSDLTYSRVFIQGQYAGQDEYGNEETSLILNAGYDAATVQKINVDNVVVSNIWDLRDAGMVHQDLQ